LNQGKMVRLVKEVPLSDCPCKIENHKPSTKMWLDEKQLRSGRQFLDVPRWARHEKEPDNPRLWRWTPEATRFEIKTGWLAPDQTEWIPTGKVDRAQQIHRWVYT
jgi:hypothetical protein